MKSLSLRLVLYGTLCTLLLTACAAPATPPPFGAVEELTFQYGPFKMVGDLRMPAGKDPYKPGLLASFPFAPGFLDLMENWLKGLYADGQ